MSAANPRAKLTAQLIEGIALLSSSVQWQQYLDVQSRFHRYSAGNALLILNQGSSATQVAGFHAWRRLHRQVRRGERAIWILAPVIGRPSRLDEPDREVVTFRWVPVFDISQTEGAALPEVCARVEGGDPHDYFGALVDVARKFGFGVEDHEFASATNGDCSHEARRIRVEVRAAPAQRVKTLVHELAHARLHEVVEQRAIAELEAESIAYVVCQVLGIDTSAYSFGYVSAWAGDGEAAIAGIRACCGRIQNGAEEILDALGEFMPAAAGRAPNQEMRVGATPSR